MLISPGNASSIKAAEEISSCLQLDFDSEVDSHLFRVRGDINLMGNRSLPYLMLNATLLEGGKALQITKYLMIDLQPGRDHSFEIAKSMQIPPGDYVCSLEVSGPAGTLASETRSCRVIEPWIEPASAIASGPSQELPFEIIELLYGQEEDGGNKEGRGKRESGSEKEDQEHEIEAWQARSISSSSDRLNENLSPARSDAPAPEESDSSRELDAEFVGSSSSKKYHLPECRYAQKIKADNRIVFASRQEAEEKGYLPCKVCNP